MPSTCDLQEFDNFLRERCVQLRMKLRDMLGGRKLTLAKARRHRVLLPMVGVYTPGGQALPACSWEFVDCHSQQLRARLQTRFRAMMFSALGYYPESAGIYLGASPRLCMVMDTEYNQVRDESSSAASCRSLMAELHWVSMPAARCDPI
jgi:hypothetical protein